MRLKRLIAWTIYEERQKRGWSQERLGKAAGCHRTTVAKIEAEELQSMDLVEAILDALDVNEFAQLVKDKSPVRATKQAPADKLPNEAPKPRQKLPSARPKGKWEKGTGENGVTTSLFCSNCWQENPHWYDWNFCPNCGSEMEHE